MTVKKFLEQNNVVSYVLTDRMRVPIREDYLKYLDLDDVDVIASEVKKGILHIHTDFMEPGC